MRKSNMLQPLVTKGRNQLAKALSKSSIVKARVRIRSTFENKASCSRSELLPVSICASAMLLPKFCRKKE
jgi:hypothetical protein